MYYHCYYFTVLKVLARAIELKEDKNGTQIGKEVRLPLFVSDPKDSTKKN